ncbi:hypothetical protein PF002_g14727 [Phytophthora fragariae]|uniref:Pectate lyase n=1 Tax=Phytophthora fragariae TaxID=53985 RepID=A0A6A3YTX8_9STRA|nr:hypothetical protein PF011_g12954 [Phytophthora fragariae]KAE9224337.1 hypothetical protein PF002_g14727 [Phytophthora fragariae]KAE9347442.1 hypothetical protein PF008_g7807 [Phytophthora fragariae]
MTGVYGKTVKYRIVIFLSYSLTKPACAMYPCNPPNEVNCFRATIVSDRRTTRCAGPTHASIFDDGVQVDRRALPLLAARPRPSS